jgi:hypothetical protein
MPTTKSALAAARTARAAKRATRTGGSSDEDLTWDLTDMEPGGDLEAWLAHSIRVWGMGVNCDLVASIIEVVERDIADCKALKDRFEKGKNAEDARAYVYEEGRLNALETLAERLRAVVASREKEMRAEWDRSRSLTGRAGRILPPF